MLAGPFSGTFHASGLCRHRGGASGSSLVRHQRQLGGRCARSLVRRPGALPRPRNSSRRPGQSLLLPGADGALSRCAVWPRTRRTSRSKDRFLPGRLTGLLPAGAYRFANAPHDARLAALAFALGSYKFTRYRKAEPNGAQLEVPDGHRRRRALAHRRGRRTRARSDQHAGERSGARRARAGRARARRKARREHPQRSSATIC